MAFVIAAVSLILGILIFSEITEAMAETIPEILVTIPTTPEVEGLWELREHCIHPFCSLTNNAGTNYYTHEYKLVVTIQSADGFDGVVDIAGSGGAPRSTAGQLFKVFDKSVLDGKLITWEVKGDVNNSVDPDLIFYDGELDPLVTNWNGSAVAHPNPNLFPCGIDCFSDANGVIKSGSGGEIIVISPPLPNGTPLANYTGSANLSSFDSPTGKVTLAIIQRDANQSTFMGSQHFQVTIADHGTYRFKSDPNNPAWNGATLKCISVKSCTNQSAGLKEESAWSITSLPPPAIPVVNSQDTLDANAAFDRTVNIGWTVISIIPITLFFALFTLFSPRIDGDAF